MTEGIRIGTPSCICPPAQCTDLYGIGTRGRGRCAELSYYHVSVNCGASVRTGTCATLELRDLLRSGATSHLTGTTQLTEGPRSQQVPDLKSRGGYPYNNLVFGEIRDHGEVQGSLNFKTPYSVPVCKYVYGTARPGF